MQAAQGSVSRGVRAGEQHEPSRKWLGKREWQDVRRACTLGANGNLYAAELHGVKLLFRWEKAHASPVESNGEKRTSTSERQTHGRPASAPRRSKPAAEELNSRKRRSAHRLLEFMRAKGTQEGTAAASAPAGSPPPASTSRPETGVRAPAAADPEQQRKPKTVESDSLTETDHAAKLYTAWKQGALVGSPAQGKERETVDASPTRARGCTREKRAAPESGGSRSSCSCSSEHMSTDMTTPDSDTYAGRPRLEPIPIEPPMGAMRGRGSAKRKGGGKNRGKSRGKGRR